MTGDPRKLRFGVARDFVSVPARLYMPPLLTLPEFARFLGISQRLVYKLLQQDDAPPIIRLGRRVLIRRAAAEQWLAARESRHAPPR